MQESGPENPPTFKITVLGTGTSQGVPVIGCDCRVCRSADPRDHRLRVSVMVTIGNKNIVIDAGPDFRYQMLRSGTEQLDAILITHEHNDHIIGLDDVRPFNFKQWKNMPLYATRLVQEQIKTRFGYIFEEDPYPGAPRITLHTISKEKEFLVDGVRVRPVEVLHGNLPVLGFRFGDFTYLTDVKTISPEEKEKVYGTKVLILNALHHNEHHSHLNLKEALDLIGELQPEQAYLTHISHRMGLHAEVERDLPSGVRLAYDGLILES